MAVTTTSVLTSTSANEINWQSEALKFAMPYLAYAMFGVKDAVSERRGLTVKWYKHHEASETTATLAENPTWAPSSIVVDTVTAQLALYGDGQEITEILDKNSVFDLRPDMLVWAGEAAGRSINAVTRAALLAGATVVHSNGKTSATLASTDTATVDDFITAGKLLKNNDAPTFMVGGEPCYIAIISPTVEAQLLRTTAFRDMVRYASANRLFTGYIGTLMGICFVRTSTTVQTTVTGVTAEQSIVCGKGFYGTPAMPLLGGTNGVPDFSGMAPTGEEMMYSNAALSEMFKVLVTEPGNGSGGGAHGDEWATRFKVAYKAYWKPVILDTRWGYNLKSATGNG